MSVGQDGSRLLRAPPGCGLSVQCADPGITLGQEQAAGPGVSADHPSPNQRSMATDKKMKDNAA